jgi:hypothetical protein
VGEELNASPAPATNSFALMSERSSRRIEVIVRMQ